MCVNNLKNMKKHTYVLQFHYIENIALSLK